MEPVLDVLSRVSGSKNLYDINEEIYKSIVSRHLASRREGKASAEFDLKDIRFEDIAGRVRTSVLNKRSPPSKMFELSTEKIKVINLLFLLIKKRILMVFIYSFSRNS